MAPTTRCRAGISLLEVLISISVAVTGLFGVLVMIPMAARQAQVGLDSEDSSSLGRRMISDFKVRGMHNPNNWIWHDGAQWTMVQDPTSFSAPHYVLPNEAFCIDPEFLAFNGPVPSAAASVFPFTVAANQPFMRRLSLRDRRFPVSQVPPLMPPVAISGAQAEQMFTGSDRLMLQKPTNDLLPPVQKFFGEDAGLAIKRMSEGDMSWFAMVVPQFRFTTPGGAGMLPHNDSAFVRSSLYTLYIVVTKQRNLALSAALPTERVLPVVNGLGGAGQQDVRDLQLSTLPGGTEDEVSVSSGQWIMLSQQIGTQDLGGGPQPVYDFKWYRVIRTDEPVQNGTAWTRYVTVEGPDWVVPANPLPPGTVPTHAIIVSDVAAVYEKNIRLESPSLWSQ